MKFLLPLLLAITASLAMEINQAPVTLPGSAWQVTSFAGKNPLEDHPISFKFDTEGNIAGDTSCNRFGGSCAIDGNTLAIGPLRSTRRACQPEVMQQEQDFLALLGAAATWKIDGEELVLTAPAGEIRSRRATAPSTP